MYMSALSSAYSNSCLSLAIVLGMRYHFSVNFFLKAGGVLVFNIFDTGFLYMALAALELSMYSLKLKDINLPMPY